MAGEMRALSIQHPWAAAIAYGTKRVENRTWRVPGGVTGQTIAIHAGKKAHLGARAPSGESWPAHRMHLGAVIAVATVTGCHHAEECMLPASAVPPGVRAGCSPWAAREQWHIELSNVRPLGGPVPCRGMLGLWRLPEDVEKAVQAQLEAGQP